MKKNLLFSIMPLLLTFAGCEKINDLIAFNIKNETEVSIPSQSVISLPIIVRSPEVKTSSEQSFKNNNTKAELVETAQLTELRLTIISPDQQSFDFLNEIILYIKDDNGNEEPVAFKYDIPEDGSKEIILDTSDTNLKPFIQQDNFTIITDVKTDQVVNENIDIKINMVFRVKAKVF